MESRGRAFGNERDWIPFYSLRSPADFFAWRDDVVNRSPTADRTELAYQLSEAYRYGLEAFHKYSLPAVIVEHNLEPAAIARIFERVNRGGLALATYDLMVARTYEKDWNLRDKWDEARAKHTILDDYFGDDGMPILRAVALRNVGTVRESAVLSLPGQSVRTAWNDGVSAVVDAIDILRSRCGVLEPAWLPYGGMLTTLAGLAFELPLASHGDEINRWFLSRAYGLAYEAAANTRTVDEYNHLRDVLRGYAPLRPLELPGRVIFSATRKRLGAVWRAFMCTLALNA